MNFDKTLVIAAHPDDEVLGCGGLIARQAAAGCPVDVLVITDGTSTQYPGNIDMHQRRTEQLTKACEILGSGSITHWDFPDMRLTENHHLTLNERLSHYIREGEYRQILCHHPFDINLDHRVIFDSVMVATRPIPESSLEGVWSYFTNSSTEWNFSFSGARFIPTVYVDISDFLERKLKALGQYIDEVRDFPHPRSFEAVRSRAMTFGSEVGFHAAEAFHLHWCRIR